MEKYRAIPQGYMTVGQLAKKMDTTVRTLQYYDKEGVLSPTSVSEGGRRLYTDKDMVKLHQILSMKSLGFSLDEIKEQLISLDTPTDVVNALSKQAEAIKKQIHRLSETLSDIENLQKEVLQIKKVDFKKYADIIVNLKMKNEKYWLVKHFDEKILEHCRSHFNSESAMQMMLTTQQLNNMAFELSQKGVRPESKEGQIFAKQFWSMIIDFTGGDMSLLPQLMALDSVETQTEAEKISQNSVNSFIEAALDVYLTNLEINPFENI